MKTEKEIIEENKLIVEFMEFVYLDDFNYPENNETGWYDSDGICKGTKLKFHSSWDWLMPVVNKCYNLQYNKGWKKENCIQHCLASYDFMSNIVIEIVWEEVIKFIKWYNTKKDE